MIFLYTFALWLLLPYIFLHLIWRARRQPEYLRHIGERFGYYCFSCDKPIIWLHAVSVGETRAAQSLIILLQATYPLHQVLLTHTTPTGRTAGQQLYGTDILQAYLPYDYPFAVSKFLFHFKPVVGILMETEIWFNLIRTCKLTHTPLLLLNARMSEKSAKIYARFARLTHDALRNLAAISAQTSDDALRLSNLGASNVSVMGNLKFDINPPPALLELGKQMRERFGHARKIFLAASTRDGEEALLLDALKYISIPGFLLVIVPRHPQRFSLVAKMLEQRRIKFFRRSELSHSAMSSKAGMNVPFVPADTQVVLGDSMGEMFAYFAAADIAFIGGSLLPFGGQNLIEACAMGTPVLTGPHMYNFSEATRLAVSAGVAIQVPDLPALLTETKFLFQNPATLQHMHEQSAKFIESNRGATDKSFQLVKKHLGLVTHPDSLRPAHSSQ